VCFACVSCRFGLVLACLIADGRLTLCAPASDQCIYTLDHGAMAAFRVSYSVAAAFWCTTWFFCNRLNRVLNIESWWVSRSGAQ
jgi:hypothetical protein